MRRSENLTVRLLPDELAVIGMVCEVECLGSLSEAARLCIREFARQLGLWPPPSDGQGERRQDIEGVCQ